MSSKLGKVFLITNERNKRFFSQMSSIISFTNSWEDAQTVMFYFPDQKIKKALLEKTKNKDGSEIKCIVPGILEYSRYFNEPAAGFVGSDLVSYEPVIASNFAKARLHGKKVIMIGEFSCATLSVFFNFPIVYPISYSGDRIHHQPLDNFLPKKLSEHVVQYSIDGVENSNYIKSKHMLLINPGLNPVFKKGVDYEIFSTTSEVEDYKHNGDNFQVLSMSSIPTEPFEDEIASFYVPKHETLFILDDCLNVTETNEEYLVTSGVQYMGDMLSLFEDKF